MKAVVVLEVETWGEEDDTLAGLKERIEGDIKYQKKVKVVYIKPLEEKKK